MPAPQVPENAAGVPPPQAPQPPPPQQQQQQQQSGGLTEGEKEEERELLKKEAMRHLARAWDFLLRANDDADADKVEELGWELFTRSNFRDATQAIGTSPPNSENEEDEV